MLKELLSFEAQVVFAFLLSLGTCYLLIPPIRRLAIDKDFVASISNRACHDYPIPTIGGVAIYFSFLISTLIFAGIKNEPFLPYMTASTLFILMVGLKDDVYVISPRVKLMGEFIAIVIAVVLANIRITDFHGVFGIHEIPYLASVFFSIFVFVAITNAFNLMDGIDGLSASLGIISCVGFGIFFLKMEKYGASILCASMIGSLVAFLRFNYAGPKKKIFMGDTGSLIIGFIVAGVAIRYNEINLSAPIGVKIHASPILSVAILAIPIFDTLRVMIFRILRKKSPFSADKTHIHHILLTKGYSHHNATILISVFSIFLIIMMYAIHEKVSANSLLLILIGTVAAFYLIPFTLLFKLLISFFKELFKKK